MRKLTIEETTNGYVLTWNEEESEESGGLIRRKKVIEDKPLKEYEDHDWRPNRRAMKELLAEVAEHFGYHYDKYKKYNLKITFKNKGYKLS